MILQKIRDRAQSWFAYTIIAILIVPFAMWGIDSYFEVSGPNHVALVGGQSIPQHEFQNAYQQRRQQLQEMLGDKADAMLADTERLKQGVLKQLIGEYVQHQLVKAQGLRVGDVKLRDAILAMPIFEKGFDAELYERALRSRGHSTGSFEEGLRRSLAIEQLRDGITDSAFITPAEMDARLSLLKQQREVQYVVLKLSDASAKVTVEEAAIATYFEENKANFVKPEQVRLQFVELKLDTIAEGIHPTEDELRAAYQDQQDKYGRPEERSASHILVTVEKGAPAERMEAARQRAQAIADSIHTSGKSFDHALQEAKTDAQGGVEGGPLGVITKKMFDDPAFENALYALQKVGDVSQPVKMPTGFHIIKLDVLTPAEVKPFEVVRELVAKNLRHQQAESRLYEQAQTLATLGFEHADELETVAKALGATVQESDWFSRKSGTGIALYPKVTEAAFSDDVLKRGVNSAPIDISANHVVMVRAKEHKEPVPQTLEEARDAITKTLREQQAKESLAKTAVELKKAAAEGTHLLTLAERFSGVFYNVGLVEREEGTIPAPIAEVAFRLPTPETGKVALGTATLQNGDQVVLEVFRVLTGRKDSVPESERNVLANQEARQLGARHFEHLLESQRAQTKVDIYKDKM